MLEYGNYDNNRLGRNYLLPSPSKTPCNYNPISDERYLEYQSSRNNNFDKVSNSSNHLFVDKDQRHNNSQLNNPYNAYSPNKNYIDNASNRKNEIAAKMRFIHSSSGGISTYRRDGSSGMINAAHQSMASDSYMLDNLGRNVQKSFENVMRRDLNLPKMDTSMSSRGGNIGRSQSKKGRRRSLWDKEIHGNEPKKKTKGYNSSYVIDQDLIEEEDGKRQKKELPQLKNKLEGHGHVGNVGAVDTSGFDGFSIMSNRKGSVGLEGLIGDCISKKVHNENCRDSVTLTQPKHIDVEYDSAFQKFDVFDYEHQNADVAKLPIVEPDLIPIGSPNKVVDLIEKSQLLLQPTHIEVEKDNMFQKFDYSHQDADVNALPIIDPHLSLVDSSNKVGDKIETKTLAQPKHIEVEYDDIFQKFDVFDYSHQDADVNALPIIDPHLSLVDSSNKVADKIETKTLAQPKHIEAEYDDIFQKFDVFDYSHQDADFNALPIIDPHLSFVDSSNKVADKIEIEALAQPKHIEVEYDDIFQKFDVFDYGHQNADVDKLPIVDPLLPSSDLSNQVINQVEIDSITSDSVNMTNNVELINVNNYMIDQIINVPLLDIPLPSTSLVPEEKITHLKDLQTQLKELANLITIGSISSVSIKSNNVGLNNVNNNVDVVPETIDTPSLHISRPCIVPTEEVIIQLKDNIEKSVAKLAYDFNRACKKPDKQVFCNKKRQLIVNEKEKDWKLIDLDVPVRNAFTNDNVDISRCHPSDPRVTRS